MADHEPAAGTAAPRRRFASGVLRGRSATAGPIAEVVSASRGRPDACVGDRSIESLQPAWMGALT
jgi:hypothetical protein